MLSPDVWILSGPGCTEFPIQEFLVCSICGVLFCLLFLYHLILEYSPPSISVISCALRGVRQESPTEEDTNARIQESSPQVWPKPLVMLPHGLAPSYVSSFSCVYLRFCCVFAFLALKGNGGPGSGRFLPPFWHQPPLRPCGFVVGPDWARRRCFLCCGAFFNANMDSGRSAGKQGEEKAWEPH